MKVLLINSPSGRPEDFPLGLAYIAGAIEKDGHSVKVLDCNINGWLTNAFEHVQREMESFKPDVIGMGAMITQYNFIKNLSKDIKKHYPEKKIILGGVITKSIPERIMKETPIDILVINYGDRIIQEVLKTLGKKKSLKKVKGICFRDKGKVIINMPAPPIDDLDKLGIPFYDVFEVERYIQYNSYKRQGKTIRPFPIIASRGCPYHCTFCISECFSRMRSTEHLFKEIDFLIKKYKVNEFVFRDELSFLTEEKVNTFCNYYHKNHYSFSWTCVMRADRINESMIIKMKKAGCRYIGYGFESGSQKILNYMKKGITVEQILKVGELHKKYGLGFASGFIVGMPIETRETLDETLKLCIKMGATNSKLFEGNFPTQFFFATPFPHTELYDEAIKTHKIKNLDKYFKELGDRYLLASTLDDLLVNLTKFSDDELLTLRWKMENKINFAYFKNHKTDCLKQVLSKSPLLALRSILESTIILLKGYPKGHKKIHDLKTFIRTKIGYFSQKR